MTRLFCTIVVLAGNVVSGTDARAANYIDVQMSVSQTNFYPRAKEKGGVRQTASAPNILSWNARCSIGSRDWVIESDFLRNSISTYYFDGTNVYRTKRGVQGPRAAHVPSGMMEAYMKAVRATSTMDSEANPTIQLTVTPGEHPLDNLGANLPWLIFCSGHCIRQPKRLLPLAGAEIRHVPWAFGCRDETKTFTDTLGLPCEIKFFTSNKLLKKAPLHESLLRTGDQVTQIRLSADQMMMSADNFLRANYRVLEYTNVEGHDIPTLISYTQYLPGDNGESSKTLSLVGKVTSLKSIEGINPLLTMGQKYYVIDYRFRESRKLIDNIHYVITNGVVPQKEAPRLQALFRTSSSHASIDPLIKAHFGIYGLVTTFLAGPVIVAIVMQLRKLKNRH